MTAAGRTSRRRGRLGRGYTAVEVMLAITVLLISTAGVMAMQTASIQGNLDARKLDVANSVARTWLDRLATDASYWTSGTNPVMQQTLLLTTLAPQTPGQGTFQVTPLTVAGVNWSPAFDIFGRDVAVGSASTVFCTHIEVDTLASDTLGPTLVRATVMVFWQTNLLGGTAPATTVCPGPTNVSGAATGTYHTLFATESLRRAS